MWWRVPIKINSPGRSFCGCSAAYHLDIRTLLHDGDRYSIKIWGSPGLILVWFWSKPDVDGQCLLPCAVDIVSFLFKGALLVYFSKPNFCLVTKLLVYNCIPNPRRSELLQTTLHAQGLCCTIKPELFPVFSVNSLGFRKPIRWWHYCPSNKILLFF